MIEASGVAEPKNIREEFIEAAESHQVVPFGLLLNLILFRFSLC